MAKTKPNLTNSQLGKGKKILAGSRWQAPHTLKPHTPEDVGRRKLEGSGCVEQTEMAGKSLSPTSTSRGQKFLVLFCVRAERGKHTSAFKTVTEKHYI